MKPLHDVGSCVYNDQHMRFPTARDIAEFLRLSRGLGRFEILGVSYSGPHTVQILSKWYGRAHRRGGSRGKISRFERASTLVSADPLPHFSHFCNIGSQAPWSFFPGHDEPVMNLNGVHELTVVERFSYARLLPREDLHHMSRNQLDGVCSLPP